MKCPWNDFSSSNQFPKSQSLLHTLIKRLIRGKLKLKSSHQSLKRGQLKQVSVLTLMQILMKRTLSNQTLNFGYPILTGTQPENTHGIQTQTQSNPYPNFGSGLGIILGYLNFGYPILALVYTYTS